MKGCSAKAVKIKKNILLIIIIAGTIIICSAGYQFFYYAHKIVPEIQYFSAISWLDAAVRESLYDYWQCNKKYPDKLSELKIPFPGDGANPEMLEKFSYSSDGQSYKIEWSIPYMNNTLTRHNSAIEGKKEVSKSYLNGHLVE